MTCVEIASCHPAKIGGFFGCKINVFACENDVAHSVFFVFFAKSKNVDFCQIYVGKRASKVNISSNFPECVRIFPENVRETPPEIPNFGGVGTLCTKSMFSRVNLMLHVHVFKSRNFVKNIRFSRVNLRKTRKVQICPKFPKNLQNLQISDISEKHENSVLFFQ